MSRALRCTFCDQPLERGAERCPRCLRKSSVGDSAIKVRVATPLGDGDEAPASAPPSHAGIRAIVLFLAYGVYGPLTWLVVGHQAWLEARSLWMPGCFAAMALGTLPLRMAFAPPESRMDGREAARHYALLMLAVLGIAAGLFAAQALAVWLVEDGIGAMFLGLLFFLAPLLVVPAIVKARREKGSKRDALAAALKGLGLAIAVVAAVALLAALRASKVR